ncbi:hypothetical protein KAF25_005034 [Fusarium avenaceum]|uniref:Uncharacterized protein n=1 Tax=Fusarium avenaceum TaxID=40199 RepID=A0A9P7H4W4_9HYPO|nr:hypothetical protein KAF25_005034 [Fusarium avenaceum]
MLLKMEAPNCEGLNATECLLHVTASILDQLREESRDFNWDPASSVVTLVIGIIAAAFAFFAIIQGFLAAGPGRHKCSKYAIGTWARLSKRHFDWSELRYRSIAQTPVISATSLINKMKINYDIVEWKEDDSVFWDHDQLFSKLNHDRKSIRDYFPATWLKLLTYSGMHHPELWWKKPQGTDYLPADLAAAPAYSTVADLVTIASIAAGEIRFDRTGQSTADEASMVRLTERVWGEITSMGRPEQGRLDKGIFALGQIPAASPILEELYRIDTWIEKTENRDQMVCRIMALAFTTSVCKQMYQGNQLGRKWPDTCAISQEERNDLDETYDSGKKVPNSFSAVTKLVSRQVRKLREYQDNPPAGAVSADQYFTRSCAEDDRTSQLSDKPFRFLEYMEHITKLWEKDGDNFKYLANEVQHPLDDLLIYRATLMHMVISQAADNSHILSNPNYYKLIPVI